MKEYRTCKGPKKVLLAHNQGLPAFLLQDNLWQLSRKLLIRYCNCKFILHCNSKLLHFETAMVLI